jgi:hypothetical protein
MNVWYSRPVFFVESAGGEWPRRVVEAGSAVEGLKVMKWLSPSIDIVAALAAWGNF